MTFIEYGLNRKIPILKEVDVCVVGGGPGGLSAAVMAARQGASTLLVERFSGLGGMAWNGEVSPFMMNHASLEKALDQPVYHEWRKAMIRYTRPESRRDEFTVACAADVQRRINKDAAMLGAEDLCLDAGVQLLFHHTLFDVVMDGKRIAAAVFHSKSGLAAIRAKVFVDSTGDADLASLAGCPCESGNADGFCQPMTLCFKVSHVDRRKMPSRAEINAIYKQAKAAGEFDCPRENLLYFETDDPDVIHFNTTRVIKKNAVNAVELSESEIEGRRQLRELLTFMRRRIPGFEQAVIHSVAAHIGIRESRRVRGRHYLTVDDFDRFRKFPDAIARVNYPVDIHNPSGSGTEIKVIPEGEWYEIPYGCLVPENCDNLLVGSRSISVDHILHSSMRIMPVVCSVGQAAGLAAAMAAARNCPPAALNGVEVRRHLATAGAYL